MVITSPSVSHPFLPNAASSIARETTLHSNPFKALNESLSLLSILPALLTWNYGKRDVGHFEASQSFLIDCVASSLSFFLFFAVCQSAWLYFSPWNKFNRVHYAFSHVFAFLISLLSSMSAYFHACLSVSVYLYVNLNRSVGLFLHLLCRLRQSARLLVCLFVFVVSLWDHNRQKEKAINDFVIAIKLILTWRFYFLSWSFVVFAVLNN